MEVRKYSNKFMELVETGVLDPVDAVRMCVKWMSEDDVQGMMSANEIEYDYEPEEDDEKTEKFDYIVNAGKTKDNLCPTCAYKSKEDAIEGAQRLVAAETRLKFAEVVYMPEDDDDINEVVYTIERTK